MRGLEGIVVLNSTEKPKSADYKKLRLNSNNALMPFKRRPLDSPRTSTLKRFPAKCVSSARGTRSKSLAADSCSGDDDSDGGSTNMAATAVLQALLHWLLQKQAVSAPVEHRG